MPDSVKLDLVEKQRCQGLVCVFEYPQYAINVAAILRTLDCMGVSEMYIVGKLPTSRGDQKKLKSVSRSACKWVRTSYFDTTIECVTALAEASFISIATLPHVKGKNNVLVTQLPPWIMSERLAVWFGNESRGLTDKALESASVCIQIPVYGMSDCLNVSCSAAIVMHTLSEQKRALE
jgi:tRNA (guanosine-2'-O-)-methyltransferase